MPCNGLSQCSVKMTFHTSGSVGHWPYIHSVEAYYNSYNSYGGGFVFSKKGVRKKGVLENPLNPPGYGPALRVTSEVGIVRLISLVSYSCVSF